MNRLNFIEIETRWGFRSFELYCDDITKMDEKVDLLAFSILEKFYLPTPNTVVGSLIKTHHIDLKTLADNCEFDLRKIFSCWVSKEITNEIFKRLLCVELLGKVSTEEIIENIFVMLSILEAKGIPVKEFALPILGTGSLRLDYKNVVKPLLEHSLKYLQNSQFLQRIKFVEIDEKKARQLSASMDEILGRMRAVQPRGKDIDNLKKKITYQLENISSLPLEGDLAILNDLRRVLSDPDCHLFELNMTSRKLLEVILSQMTAIPQKNLFERIEEVKKQAQFSEWLPYYMHLIRVFGNSTVHGNEINKNQIISKEDIEVGLICLSQVIDAWSTNLKQAQLR